MSIVVHAVGLGSMGLGMAQSAARAGLQVYGFDPVEDRVQALIDAGGYRLDAASPMASVLMCVVLNGDQMRSALFGPDGRSSAVNEGGVILGCATIAPEIAREMEASAEAKGLLYLDAPISGGAAKAAAGKLSIMASGRPAAFTIAEPLLSTIAETVHRLGEEAGPGSAMKAVNQLLAGLHIAAMGEALTFAASQGLPLDRVVDIVAASAGTSWMFENRAPHVVNGDYTPRSALAIWPKDLGIVCDIASTKGLSLPLVTATLDEYRQAAAAGLSGEDDAAIAKFCARRAGIKLPGDAG